jgi:CDP-paratose 2-epimerase
VVYDDLSRPQVEANLEWLRERHGKSAVELVVADVGDRVAMSRAVARADVVVHLAAQTAVTTSVIDPRADFQNNAGGTLNVLEAVRASKTPPIVLYASTNKVYGPMADMPIVERKTRYAYQEPIVAIGETQPLDFYSPYGCSKGAGDQYVHDYARIYGLRTVVFRQSCIYGPRQMGVEDQGWLAWFIIAALTERPIHIYGDGKQVRDVLFVDDLLDVYDAAVANIERAAGQVYNIGGGPELTLSVWIEFSNSLERLFGRPVKAAFSDWRPGDQRIYVSDNRKAGRDLGWSPKVGVAAGLKLLHDWAVANRTLFSAKTFA